MTMLRNIFILCLVFTQQSFAVLTSQLPAASAGDVSVTRTSFPTIDAQLQDWEKIFWGP